MMNLSLLFVVFVILSEGDGFADNAVATDSDTKRTSIVRDYQLHVELSAGGTYDSHGFKDKAEGRTKTTEIETYVLRAGVFGSLNDDTQFKIILNPLAAQDEVPLDEAFLEVDVFKSLRLRGGRDALLIHGWRGMDSVNRQSLFGVSPYEAMEPFARYDSVVGLQFRFLGEVSLQLTNDVTTLQEDGVGPLARSKGLSTYTKHRQQPVGIVCWRGDFGPITPLVQGVSYDTNHSLLYVVGLRSKISGFEMLIDFSVDKWMVPAAVDATDRDFVYYRQGMLQIHAEPFPGVRPFVGYVYFDRSSEEHVVGVDKRIEVNSVSDVIDDNFSGGTLGISLPVWHPLVAPYFGARYGSAAFLDEMGQREERTTYQAIAGISGEI